MTTKAGNHLKIVFIVSGLLLALSLSISLINYTVALHAKQEDLVNRSLPLSVDNIYTEIQSHIIEPVLVSSMMASDTFVRDWLLHEESDRGKITSYLETIRNRYKMFVTFLVSERTGNYYTHEGFLETIAPDNPNNQWYYDFKARPDDHEINLDLNDNLDNALLMFINYKIYDADYHLIGATGIGHRISYVDAMLRRFREQYRFNVYFIDAEGRIVLSERRHGGVAHLRETPPLYEKREVLLSEESQTLSYEHEGHEHLVITKPVPELNLTLFVEATMDDFTEDIHQTFYFNLGATLLVTLAVTFVILITILSYNRKLEHLADHDGLTGLLNRRAFNAKLEHFHQLSRRNGSKLSLIFFDLDDFKQINDRYGHHTGDRVLVRFAEMIRNEIRHTDLLCRWGGEEFVIGLIDTDVERTEKIAEKLKARFREDGVIQEIVRAPVNASFGVTACQGDESLEGTLVRLDRAMYLAKEGGKNRVHVL